VLRRVAGGRVAETAIASSSALALLAPGQQINEASSSWQARLVIVV